MEDPSGIETKSSNEILSELFGAFNAEPPEIIDKSKTHSDGENSDHFKKPKKYKRKKSKKKHKSKSKKHKRKHSNHDSCAESECSSSRMKKKKKSHKEKKVRKKALVTSPRNVNIELSVNQVPMALEIMLDGTVGIKGEDGVVKKIPDDKDHDPYSDAGDTTVAVESGNAECAAINVNVNPNVNKPDKTLDIEKTDEKKFSNPIKVQEVFEAEAVQQNEKQKKGKIQIRDLKFSSVFQETVKAVEEKQKKEQERRADIEEGELSESSGSEQHLEYPETEDKSKRRSRVESVHHYNSLVSYENDEIGLHSRGVPFGSRIRSSSRSRSCSRNHRSKSSHHHHHRSRSRYSRERSGYRSHRSRSRSRSKDYHPSYYSGHSHRKRSRRSSSQSKKSHHSRSKDRHRSSSRSRRSREKRIKLDSSHRSDSLNRSKTKSKERPVVISTIEDRHELSRQPFNIPSNHSRGHNTLHVVRSLRLISESVEKIDKEKLLAIARKNALKLIDAGMVPGSEKLTAIKAGGKTVNELTEYCKKLSEKDALGKEISDSDSESSDDGDKLFHHPFQVRDRPNSIILNIKNSIPLPVKSLQEKAAEQSKQLRLQFPVSSGTSHRRTESEWIPVSPKKEELPEKPALVKETIRNPPLFANPPPTEVDPSMVRIPQPLMSAMTDFSAVYPHEVYNRPVFPVIQPNPPVPKPDISSIVSKRLDAMRKLQENPNDTQALDEMHNAQQEMQFWAESKQDLGAFTGSTGTKILSAAELSSGAHAWAKRNQLTAATPVRGGMGMALLQKMGWQPGEGLGKNKEGTLEPLRLEVKMDKKGLVASDESKKGKKLPLFQPNAALPTIRTLDGKHPVSLLNEFCSRRRYGVPQFELCFECGPDHKKNFLFKVRVNGIEYTPTVASPNKKQAKAEAAAVCLKALGVISITT